MINRLVDLVCKKLKKSLDYGIVPLSHIFNAYDYGINYKHQVDPISNNRLARINGVMDKTKPLDDLSGFIEDPFGNIWFSHEWNPESIQMIEDSKISVSNGVYRYPI